MLVLSAGPASTDTLQPLAAGVDDEPPPEPRGPDAPPVINRYDPSVEQWRNQIWQGMPDSLKSRPDAATLLDKTLHAVQGESSGDPGATGDNGVAHGLFQSHYVGAGATPEAQIADAWRLVQGDIQQGGTGFGDWGEGRSYQGQPFGAFGRTPYGAGDPLAQHLSTGQTSSFIPGPSIAPQPFSPYVPQPDPFQTTGAEQQMQYNQPQQDVTPYQPYVGSDLQQHLSTGGPMVVNPDTDAGQQTLQEMQGQANDTLNPGGNYYTPEEAAQERQARAQAIASRAGGGVLPIVGAAERASRIADIPYADRVRGAVQSGINYAIPGIEESIRYGLGNPIGPYGRQGQPTPAQAKAGAPIVAQAVNPVPTNVRDLALTLAPFARPVAEAGAELLGGSRVGQAAEEALTVARQGGRFGPRIAPYEGTTGTVVDEAGNVVRAPQAALGEPAPGPTDVGRPARPGMQFQPVGGGAPTPAEEAAQGAGRALPAPTPAEAELNVVRDFIATAPEGGSVPAREPYATTRDEEFAAAINAVGNGAQTQSALHPGIESAQEAIVNGQKLGYSDADIAAYLKRNYLGAGRALPAGPDPVDARIIAGRGVGLPPGVTSQEDVANLIDKVHGMAQEGAPARFWYERSGGAIGQAFDAPSSQANKDAAADFAWFTAQTSPRNSVTGQGSSMLKAWQQYQDGEEVRVHFPENDARMNRWVGLTPDQQDQMAVSLLRGTDGEGGRKTTNFFLDLLDEIDPARAQRLREAGGATTTVDMHIARAFGFPTDAVTPAQYDFMEKGIAEVARRQGWTLKQAQAAIWATQKSIYETADNATKALTKRALSDAAAAALEAEPDKPGLKEAAKKALASATKAETRAAKPVTVAEAGFDYQASLARHLASLNIGTAPREGTPLAEAYAKQPPEEQAVYHKDMAEALQNDSGKDLLGSVMRIPQSPEGFDQVYVGGADKALEPNQARQVSDYVAAKAWALGQSEATWVRPFFDANKGNHNGVDLAIGRPATRAEVEALKQQLGPNYVVQASPTGAWAFGKGGPAANVEANKAVVKGILDAAGQAWDNSVTVRPRSFAAEGATRTNDWEANPNGEGFTTGNRALNRPDVREAIDQLRQRVAAVQGAYEAKWTGAGGAAGTSPVPSAPEGTGPRQEQLSPQPQQAQPPTPASGGPGAAGGGAAGGGAAKPPPAAPAPPRIPSPPEVEQANQTLDSARKALLQSVVDEARLRRQGVPQEEIAQGRSRQAQGIHQGVLSGIEAGLSPEEIAAQGAAGARTGQLRKTFAGAPQVSPDQRAALIDEANRQLFTGQIQEFDWLRTVGTKNNPGALTKALEGRGLQPNEIEMLRKVYGDAVAEAVMPQGLTLQEALEASRSQRFEPPSPNPNAPELNLGLQGAQMGALGPQAQGPLGMPATPEGAIPAGSLNTPEARTALLRERAKRPAGFPGTGEASDVTSGLFPGPLLESGAQAGPGLNAVPAAGPTLGQRRLNRGLTEPAGFPGTGEALGPPGGKPPVVGGAQEGFGGNLGPQLEGAKPPKGETPLGRAYRELLSLVNAPISIVTYGHEPIFRQGLGFALSHPSVAKQALADMVTVAKNPEAAALINARLNSDPYVRAAIDAGWLTENDRPAETVVNKVLNKFPGMRNSRESARMYLTSLRKMGYADEAAALFRSGNWTDEDAKALWDTVGDVTGHGLRGKSLTVGGMSPSFSPEAMFGRFRGLSDPFVPEFGHPKAGGSPLGRGARNVALKNLLALGGLALTIEGLAYASGDDLKWDLLNTPLGKVTLGPSTLDPSAGYGTIIRLAAKTADAVQSGDFGRMRDALSSFVNGQLGPVTGTMLAALSGQDWQGKDFNLVKAITENPTKQGSLARQLFVPIAANAIWDAAQASGLKGALFALPSLGAMSVDTNLLQDARDKATRRLSGGKVTSYADAQNQPLLKQQVDKDASVIEAKGSPSQYQEASDTQHAPTKAMVDQQEALFNKGMNAQKLRDTYHDATEQNISSARALSSQFAEQFASIPQTKQQDLLQKYYDLGDPNKNPSVTIGAGQVGEGDTDFDKVASVRKDFVDSLPKDQQDFINQSLQATELNKTPLHQEYDKYIEAKKQAGYFETHIDPVTKRPTGITPQQRQALDIAHPELDVASWRFGSVGGKAGSALNSTKAVQMALQTPDAQNKEITYAGLPRPVNQSPDTIAMWNYAKGPLDWYLTQLPNGPDAINEGKRLAADKSDKEYLKPLDQMDTQHRSTITGNLHRAALDSSLGDELEAYLYAFGERTSLTSQAAADKAGEIIKKYHLDQVKAPMKKAA